MCYFHVEFNCKKHFIDCGFTGDEWKIIDADIDYLHTSLNEAEF